ncbi:hypothetical protein GCM10010123_20490 [Pilimelia anulata]|uniref:Uncharacterized protein n=1 Tax=Pilimelia anulata TaxID=53371 RepID=A0A8J3F7Q8_9ACTN|nr:hypothetical protein GCM10010123_20490 [Pilimelia anulata]
MLTIMLVALATVSIPSACFLVIALRALRDATPKERIRIIHALATLPICITRVAGGTEALSARPRTRQSSGRRPQT